MAENSQSDDDGYHDKIKVIFNVKYQNNNVF